MTKPNRSSPAGLRSWTSLPPSLKDQLAGVLPEQQLLTFLPGCEAKVSAKWRSAGIARTRHFSWRSSASRSNDSSQIQPRQAGRPQAIARWELITGGDVASAGACLAGFSGGCLERQTRSCQQEPARPRPICPPDATDSSRFRHCVAVQLADSVPRQSTADALRGLEDDLGHRVRLRDHREMSALDLRDLGVGAGRHE